MLELQLDLGRNHFTLEKTFTSAWGKALSKKGYYYDKISDGSIGYKKIDCYISTNIAMYVCEIKMIENNIFKMNQLRDNQVAALKKNHSTKSPSKSIITVYSMKLDKYTIIPWEAVAHLTMNDKVELTFKNAI